MNKQKGFTIIELIVVIAIIAVLAAIVLVNVTSYINKGKDAAAEGNLASMLTNSAVWFDSATGGNGSYNNWITGTGTGAATYVSVYNSLVTAGYATVTATCNVASCAGSTSTNWCALITLKSISPAQTYCVDSTGAKVQKVSGTCLVATGTCL